MTDQLTGVRDLVLRRAALGEDSGPAGRLARSLAVTSGKGGVGKSNLSLNLGLALSRARQRVLLLDADLGLANVDVLAGVHPPLHLGHYLDGECALRDILFPLYPGLTLVPGGSGLANLAGLDPVSLEQLLYELGRLETAYDYLIIDTAAGIGPQVAAFTRCSQRTLLVTTPEPTAFMDAYASLKVCCRGRPTAVVVNQCRQAREGFATFAKLRTLGREFLHQDLDFWGAVEHDPGLGRCVAEQAPIFLRRETAVFSRAVAQIARRLTGERPPEQRQGFFASLRRYFRERG